MYGLSRFRAADQEAREAAMAVNCHGEAMGPEHPAENLWNRFSGAWIIMEHASAASPGEL